MNFISIVALICVNSLYFLTQKENGEIQDGGPRMAGQMTSFDFIWRYNQQKWYHLVEQAQGYLINVNFI